MSALTILEPDLEEVHADKSYRRVMVIWGLLFMNVIGTPGKSPVLPLPHKVAQMITQGCLPVALILALTVNRRLSVRPNWFLGLFSLLATISFTMSIRFVGIGTAYRGARLLTFVAVLWLITPWWRDRGLVLLRSHLLVLNLVLVSLAIGFVVSPAKAFSLNYGSARLDGVVWPLPATAVGHDMAVLTGLTLLLWWCGAIARRRALWLTGLGMFGLIGSHTRTALVGLGMGLLVAGISLFGSKRRVRRAFAIAGVIGLAVVLPLLPLVSSWLIRGQNTAALSSLSGRTSYWGMVLSEPRPELNKVLGDGMTNDGVLNGVPGEQGLPIDSSWIATYQNQGVVGCVLVGLTFLVLIIAALLRPPGVTRALALFLIVYCLFSSFTETGAGEASPHLLDMVLAASLLLPRARMTRASPPLDDRQRPLRVALDG